MKRGLFVFAVAVAATAATATGASAAGAAPTFAKDVAPILYNNCVVCHRPGEVAPMSLINYSDARPWAKAIKDKVVAREMPPWGADPTIGKFKNDRSLSQKDIDTIVAWVDGGAVKGEDKDLPALPNFAKGWANGREPDMIVAMGTDYELPAEGEIDVTDFYTAFPSKEDKLYKAFEVRPGVNAAVHHAGVFVVEKMPEGTKLENGRAIGPDGTQLSRNSIARLNGGSATQEGGQKLLSYVPGRGYEEYQADAGQRVKGDSYINFYMHYQATGKPEKDRTSIGMYAAKPGQEVTHQIYHGLNVGPTTYIVEGKELAGSGRGGDSELPPIPPYADNWKVVSVHSITEPITMHGLTPHLHLRGKSMKYTVTYPDGREEVLLNVPKYDFNWQVYYELSEPKKIPGGSKVTVTTLFDNSLKNPYNPAPDKEVFWSEQSWDEMYAPQVRITVDSRDLTKRPATTQQQQQQ